MRRVLSVVMLSLMGVISSVAGEVNEGELYSRGLFVPMEVLHDGKKSGTQLLVNYSVMYSGGKWIASWREVKIFQDRLSKKTVLLPLMWSSGGGEIRNIVINGDSASFDLVLAYGVARVVVGKGDNLSDEPPDVKVSITYTDRHSRKDVTEEWVMADRIVLQSKEIYRAMDGRDALFGGGDGEK